MIIVNDQITLSEDELEFNFIRSSGPGGQNVNKVATAVQLRFDVAHTPALPETVRERLIKITKNRINEQGILLIEAKRYRSQLQNREDAVARLVELIRRAAKPAKRRIKTSPTMVSRQRRLNEKKIRSEVKKQRYKGSLLS
jgi:ribosome-associated protein